MSGILKAVGKVFKAVVKVVKKIALPALAIGAVVLTGGAAIGALPSLGSMIGGLGLSSGVTAALTAAVSTAAKGALIGGLGAAISGKNILKGAGMGAGIGFAAGGLLGAGGLLAGGSSASGVAGAAGATSTGGFSSLVPGIGDAAAAAGGAGGAVPGLVATGATTAGGGLLGSIGNPMVLGPLLSGVGGGLGNAMAAKDARRAAEDERARIAGNYGSPGGLLGAGGYISQDPNRPTPTVRFDPRSYGGTYQFDRELGRVVFVPNGQG